MIFVKNKIFMIVASLSVFGCIPHNNASQGTEFYRIPDSSSTEIPFRLARAGDVEHKVFLEKKSPSREILEKYYESANLYQLREDNLESVRIEFRNLTDARFETLSRSYGGWSKAKQTYSLHPNLVRASCISFPTFFRQLCRLSLVPDLQKRAPTLVPHSK